MRNSDCSLKQLAGLQAKGAVAIHLDIPQGQQRCQNEAEWFEY